MTTPDEQYLADAVAALCGPLHEDIGTAVELTDGHFREFGMTGASYQTGRSHLSRCHLRRLLVSRGDIDGWRVPRTSAKLCLARGALSLRLLRPDATGSIPSPGPNGARIDDWANTQTSLLGVAGSRLLAIYDYDEAEHAATIRVVRPVGNLGYGRPAKVDIDFVLPDTAASLADLEFRPADDHGIVLPFEDGDGEDDESARG